MLYGVCTVLLLQSVSYILQRHLFIFVVTPSPALLSSSLLKSWGAGVRRIETKEQVKQLFGEIEILPKVSRYQQNNHVLDIIMPPGWQFITLQKVSYVTRWQS